MPTRGRPACRGIAAVALTAATATAATGIIAAAAHCPVLTGSNEVVLDGAGIGRVVFNYVVDSEHRQVPVCVVCVNPDDAAEPRCALRAHPSLRQPP